MCVWFFFLRDSHFLFCKFEWGWEMGIRSKEIRLLSWWRWKVMIVWNGMLVMGMRWFDSRCLENQVHRIACAVGEEKIGRMKPGISTWQLHPFRCLLTELAKIHGAGLMGCRKVKKAFLNSIWEVAMSPAGSCINESILIWGAEGGSPDSTNLEAENRQYL